MSHRHDGAHFAGCGCGEEHRDVVAGDGVNEGWLYACVRRAKLSRSACRSIFRRHIDTPAVRLNSPQLSRGADVTLAQVAGLNVDGAHPALNCLKPHESRGSAAVTKGCDEQVRSYCVCRRGAAA